MALGWEMFESLVYGSMVNHRIPGAAVAVWKDGATIYARGFGHRDRATHDPVDPDTVFGIASVTKSFTTMSVMQLVDRGLLNLDDPVIKHVPEFRPNTARPDAIKISHLLSHTGGLPPLPSVSYAADAGVPKTLTTPNGLISAEALSFYLKHINAGDYEVYGQPGEYFSYSNPGFVVASVIIERVSGQPFYEYVARNILEPIGMGRTTFHAADLDKMVNVTRLYSNTLQGETVPVKDWPNVRVFGASGGLKSSVNDMVKYAGVYAAGGMHGQARLLSEAGVKQMRTPVYQINRASHYGFALQITPGYSGYTLCEHGGSLPGVSSTFGFVPEARLAAVVLTNVQGAPAADIWLAAVNTALGLPLEQKRSVEPMWSAPAGYLEKFAGSYKSAEGADIQIAKTASGVVIRLPGEEFPLRATGEDYAVFNYRGQERLVRFFTKPDGSVLGLFHGTSMTGIRLVRKVS